MRISLIITTYNRPNALSLVLQSIVAQTKYPDEIIIADDGSDDSTKKCISDFQKSSTLKVIYSWQEDKGFRLSKSRNKAIAISNCYSMVGGGDTIPIIEKLSLIDNFSYLSTGGGALLKFIEGKELPILKKLGAYT